MRIRIIRIRQDQRIARQPDHPDQRRRTATPPAAVHKIRKKTSPAPCRPDSRCTFPANPRPTSIFPSRSAFEPPACCSLCTHPRGTLRRCNFATRGCTTHCRHSLHHLLFVKIRTHLPPDRRHQRKSKWILCKIAILRRFPGAICLFNQRLRCRIPRRRRQTCGGRPKRRSVITRTSVAKPTETATPARNSTGSAASPTAHLPESPPALDAPAYTRWPRHPTPPPPAWSPPRSPLL